MTYQVVFRDGTAETIEAPDKEIARAWAREDANYQDTKVKSIKEVKFTIYNKE